MSTSETITRTDLTNILNEIGVGATLVNGNVSTQFVGMGASTITTADTEQTAITLQHNSVTGRILCIGRVPLMTSRYTSTLRLRVDGVEVDVAGTNKTTDDYITLFAVKDVSIDSHTINMTIQAQDSGTTATVPGYRSLRLYAIDLEKGHYNSAIQMADYIVEQGTSGIWTYRKWNSGIAECWGTHSWTVTQWSAWGNVYESTQSYVDYPTNLFISTPWFQATGGCDETDHVGLISIEIWTLGSNIRTPTIMGSRPNAVTGSKTIVAHLQAKGRWK